MLTQAKFNKTQTFANFMLEQAPLIIEVSAGHSEFLERLGCMAVWKAGFEGYGASSRRIQAPSHLHPFNLRVQENKTYHWNADTMKYIAE